MAQVIDFAPYCDMARRGETARRCGAPGRPVRCYLPAPMMRAWERGWDRGASTTEDRLYGVVLPINKKPDAIDEE